MKISLIIAFYKNIGALSLIFKALQKQSNKEFEVIIAEDDNDEKSLTFINQAKNNLPFIIKHVRQKEDKGFKKNQMLNKAINCAEGEAIVFLDGDSVPHKHFIKEYNKNIKEEVILFGRRVMLSKTLTEKCLANNSLQFINLWQLIKTKSKRIKYMLYLPFIKSYREKGIWGCNWGILKKYLIEVNGFDEDYVKACVGEDVDIEWRLKQIGIKLMSIRYGAIVYHLHHEENYSKDDINYNFKLYAKKKELANNYCLNGLVKN